METELAADGKCRVHSASISDKLIKLSHVVSELLMK